MSDPRATRYRRLALAEQDPEKARLLRKIADEAKQGILCVSPPKTSALHSAPTPPAA